MKIKINDIPSEGLQLSKEINPIRWELSNKGLILLEKVQTHLDLAKHGEGAVYVRGSISSVMQSECSRCLKAFPYRLQSNFHLEYVPRTQSPSGGEHVLAHESLDLHYYEGDQIDIDNELIGQLLLMIPMNPLCQTACRGLCLHCGDDLNLNRCFCSSDVPDLRWAALKNLTDKESNANSKT